MSMKNQLTPAGIEPATFRFVAQRLNRCATAVPGLREYPGQISAILIQFLKDFINIMLKKNRRASFSSFFSVC